MFKVYCLVLFILINCPIIPQKISKNNSNQFLDSKRLDINNVVTRSTNVGNLDLRNNSININEEGVSWDVLGNTLNKIIFDQGLWVVGLINGEPHAAMSQWSSGYSPGPIINGQPAMETNPGDSLRYRVYKISRGDDNSNVDYKEWPYDLGAPINNIGKPLIFGNQTLWTIYNAADSSSELSGRWGRSNKKMPVAPLEIHQTIFAKKGNELDNENIFANIVFFEWTIINKGSHAIDSAFVGIWTDIDFSSGFNNPMGVDTANQLGFCWYKNKPNKKEEFEPSIGYELLYGPSVPSQGDTAIFKGKNKPNYKNLTLTSFHGIEDDGVSNPLFDNAHSVEDAWNLARGFDADGNVVFDSASMKPTKFPLSGDPKTNSGWIFGGYTGGGAGFVMFSGPFNFAPNDTQWVMAAIVPALGNNNFESIEIMRKKAEILKSLPYDTLAFGSGKYFVDYKFVVDTPITVIIPNKFELYQNYPDPFNPSTKIKYSIPIVETGNAPSLHVTLKVYDILGNEVATLINQEQAPGNYEVEFDAESANSGLSSGIYFYQLTITSGAGNFVQAKKMVLLR